MRKVYLCSVCNKGFKTEEALTQHFLPCWRVHNPKHESKPAPSKAITEREVSEDVVNFFASFNQCKK